MDSIDSKNLRTEYQSQYDWSISEKGKPVKVRLKLKQFSTSSTIMIAYYDSSDNLIKEEELRPGFRISKNKIGILNDCQDKILDQLIFTDD